MFTIYGQLIEIFDSGKQKIQKVCLSHQASFYLSDFDPQVMVAPQNQCILIPNAKYQSQITFREHR